MKEIWCYIKLGFGVYLGFQTAKIIDKSFGISDKLIGITSKVKITKEQYNHALDKSGLVYLTPEIEKLMKAKGFHISRIGYMTIFIAVWIIFKLIIFYTKHH